MLSGKSDRGLFADIAAINRYLRDEQSTYRLFVALDARDADFAAECFDSAIPAVVGAQDFQLARKYIPNPQSTVSALLRDFNDSVSRAFQLPDKRRQALRLQAYVSNFVSDVRLLVSVVRSTDGQPTAEGLARASVAGVETELVRRRVARKLAA